MAETGYLNNIFLGEAGQNRQDGKHRHRQTDWHINL